LILLDQVKPMTRSVQSLVRAACLVLPIWFLISEAVVEAQNAPKPSFDLDLSTPDVPAFTILGVAPTQIERPTTPKALGLSLLSSTTDSTNLIPNKYAVVAAPYWMQYASVTLDRYVRPDIRQSLMQTFTVSLATTPVSSNTDIGLGLSASPWAGHGSSAMADALVTLTAVDAKYSAAAGLFDVLNDIVNAKSLERLGTSPLRPGLQRFVDGPTPDLLKDFLEKRYEELFTSFVPNQAATKVIDAAALAKANAKALADAKKALNAAVDALFASDPLPLLAGPVGDLLRHVPEAPTDAASLQKARNIIAYRVLSQVIPAAIALESAAETNMRAAVAGVRSEDKLRMGWMLGLAGAFASRVPNDGFTSGRQLRWALWAAPAYRDENTHLEIVGVVKWIQRDALEGPNLFDVGARVVKQAGKGTFSAELLGRSDRSSTGSTPVTQRATINVDYQIAEKAFVTAAFGKDFADPSAGKPKGGLLSVLGVTIGLSKNPSVTAP
jgi:hypothetical protein